MEINTPQDTRYFFEMLGIPDQTERANGIGTYLAEIGSIGRRLHNLEKRFYSSIVELPGGGIIKPGRETIDEIVRELVSINQAYKGLESSMPDFEGNDVVLRTLVPGTSAYASALARASMKNLNYRLNSLENALKGLYPQVDPKINRDSLHQGTNQGGKGKVGYV